MGVFALVTNIVQEHRYKNREEIFKGLCRSDALGCIDELNSIQLKVLSILASIISAIQDWYKRGNNFTSNKVFSTMGNCISMNSGYSGRKELPDNFKILFIGVNIINENKSWQKNNININLINENLINKNKNGQDIDIE